MKSEDRTEERRIVAALMGLGYGRRQIYRVLKEAGYKAGEQAVREWLREARENYRQNTLPHLLGEQAGRVLPLLDQTEEEDHPAKPEQDDN